MKKSFALNLDTGNDPYPDLIIRTAGERRLSNFLLWQSAYSELYFSDKTWPDFKKDLELALDDYYSRTRKFGGLTNYEILEKLILNIQSKLMIGLKQNNTINCITYFFCSSWVTERTKQKYLKTLAH